MALEPGRLIRYHFLKVLRLRDQPHKVALGFALGVLVGFTPTIPIQTYLAVGLAFIFRGSAIAAAAAVWISNPLTLAAFYYAEFVVGRWIVGSEMTFHLANHSIFTLVKQTGEALWLMMIGGIAMGLPAGFVAYLFIYALFESQRRRRERCLIEKTKALDSPPKPS